MITETNGTVLELKAEVINPYSDKTVVGTMVTISTEVMVDDKLHSILNKVFLDPNSSVPKIGDEVTIEMGVGLMRDSDG